VDVGVSDLLEVGVGVFELLIDDGEHSSRSLIRVVDLQEWVTVLPLLLAILAEVEVLANAALVSDPEDGIHVAAIASDSGMYDLRLVGGGGLVGSLGDLRLRLLLGHLLENLLTLLLHLLLEELLEDVLGDAGLVPVLELLLLFLHPLALPLLVFGVGCL